ncbi:MAG TPA: hypothetical protein VND94_23105 [Terriglobia bacterium]|nr:hypothetical protein [Terriglobia bacterium]
MLMILLASAGLLAAAPHPNAAEGSASDRLQPLIFVDQPSTGAIIIDEVARRIIHDYYQRNLQAYQAGGYSDGNAHGKKNKGLPPGLAKKSTLPPGLQKQLERNGQLPPGLQYRGLPHDLLVQLPAVAPGYRYIILDDRVMLIRAATNVIMDLLQVPGL